MELCKLLDIAQIMTPYYPESNEQMEEVNQILQKSAQMYLYMYRYRTLLGGR
jgi:hypothetical protein